jgi:hypothetical protein
MNDGPPEPVEKGPAATPEVAELRSEVADLRRQLDRRDVWDTRRRRARRWFVGALVALFSIGAVASLIGVWAKRTALDTDSFVRTVRPLPQDPDVSRALAAFINEELFVTLDIDQRARDALPENLQFFVGPLESIVRNYARDAIVTVLNSDQFERIWNDAVTTAHRLTLRVLDGDDPPGVVRRDGEVVLDILPAMHDILQRIIAQGPGFLGNVELPDLDENAARGEIRRQLSDRFGVDLPADFGQIPVFQEDRLSEASDTVHLLGRLVIATIIVTILFGAGALLLSTGRRRTILQIGLGVAIATYLVFTILRVVVDDLVDLVQEGDNRAAARAAASIVSRGLRDGAWYLLIAGLLVAIGAYLAGPGRGATWVRRRTVALARWARGEAEMGADALSGTGVGRWIEANLDGLRLGGVVVGFALLLLVDHSWTGVIVLLLFLAAYEIGLTLYSRTRATEPEPPSGGGGAKSNHRMRDPASRQ